MEFTVIVKRNGIERRPTQEGDISLEGATLCKIEAEAVAIMDRYWVKKGYKSELGS